MDKVSRKRLILSGAALAPAMGAMAFAPTAGAATLPSFDDAVGAVEGAVSATGFQLPAHIPAPVIPEGNIMPMNLLRRDDSESADAKADVIPTTNAAPPEPGNVSTGHIVATQLISNDPSVVGQAVGAFTAPDSGQIADVQNALSQLLNVNDVLADVQTAYDDFMSSDAYQTWRNNSDNPFGPHEGTGIERAANGIDSLIDSLTTRPQQTIQQIIAEAGGPVRIITDPVGAFNDVVGKIAGADFVNDIQSFINNDLIPDFSDSIREALPALLLPLATAAVGALLGAPLGALALSGPGAILGALAPHNLLVGLLSAIPGAILGGLATGIPGLIGSTLALLPLVAFLPLMAASGASALALAALATATYGLWLLSMVPVTIGAAVLGVVVALVVGIGLMALSGLNPIMIPAAVAGAILAGLFVFVMAIGAYTLATFLIPTIVFLLLALPLVIGAAAIAATLGLLAGLAIAAIGIPLLTALSAIPGALTGALLGGLLGTGLSSLISALVGAALGALVGAGIGSLIGALLGGLAGVIPAIALFLVIAFTKFGDLSSAWMDGPLGRIVDALNRGWNSSDTKRMLDEIGNAWNRTDSGRAAAEILAFLNKIISTAAILDGRRLRDILFDGARAGAIPGAIGGGLLGAVLGFIAGLLNPLNLLNGLMGAITGALVGAPLGAAAGKGLSALLGALTALVVAPLSFLPILAALSALWAIPAVLSTLVGLAATIVPPLAIALAATILVGLAVSSPLWIPLTLVATVLTLVAFALSNPAIVAALTAAIPGVGGFLALGGAFIIGAVGAGLAIADLVVIIGALALAAVFVGIPAFVLTLPLFAFAGLLAPLTALLAWPLTIPMAAGLSILVGLLAGSLVDGLSSLLTVPAGALLGALLGATVGGLSATALASIVRAVVYSLAGGATGAGIGAAAGGVIGAIIALLSSTRVNAYRDGDTYVFDGRLVNNSPFGGKSDHIMVPTATDANFGTGNTNTTDRKLVDVTDLIPA